MDLQKLSIDGKESLLTVPRGDFQASSSSKASSSRDDSNSSTKTTSELLLVQLPAGFSARDLKNSHFVAKRQQQAALVCNSKQVSFSLSRVETSNTLVVVPPLAPGNNNNNNNQQKAAPEKTTEKEGDAPPSKKTKLCTTTLVPARLLNQAQGASFLELRPKKLQMAHLRQALASWTLDYGDDDNNSLQGRSVTSLAHELQQSAPQVLNCLHRLEGAYALQDETIVEEEDCCFVILSDEVQLNVHRVILSKLAEDDAYHDYAQTAVDVDRFVTEAAAEMTPQERGFVGAEQQLQGVIRHCLVRLAADDEDVESLSYRRRSGAGAGLTVKLSVAKVAQWVARRLFSLQSDPWLETLFLTRWQTELPGVGDAYQVSTDMLRGLAIHHLHQHNDEDDDDDDDDDDGDNNEERFWRYLPANQIMNCPTASTRSRTHTRRPNTSQDETTATTVAAPTGAAALDERTSQAFDLLFEFKKSWLFDELEPYLDAIVDATATSQANLLVLYTRVVQEEIQPGVSVKLYEKR